MLKACQITRQSALDFAFIAIVLLIPAIVLAPPRSSLLCFGDFPQQYTVATMMLSGRGSSVYDYGSLKRYQEKVFKESLNLSPCYLPPFSLAIIAPLALMPSQSAYIVWKLSLVFCLALAVLLTARFFQLTRRGMLWLTAWLAISGPVWEALRHVQLSCLLLLSLMGSLTLLRQKRQLLAGIALSPWLLKPHLIVPLLAYLTGAKMGVRLLAGLIVASIAIAVASFSLLGSGSLDSYLALIAESTAHPEWMGTELTPTLRGQLLRLHLLPFPIVSLTAAGLALAIIVLCACLGKQAAATRYPLELGALLCLPAGVIASGHCHNYDLLIMLPAIVVAFQQPWSEPPTGMSRLIPAILALLITMPVYNLIHYTYVLEGGFPVNPILVALAVFCLYALYVCVRSTRQPLGNASSSTAAESSRMRRASEEHE